MVSAIRTVGHEERLSLVDHLDELRTRLIVSGAVLVVAFAFCFWQNHLLLEVINKPLTAQTRKQVEKGDGTVGQAVLAQKAILKISSDTRAALGVITKPGSGLSATTRSQLTPRISALKSDVAAVPRNAQGDKPAVLGVGESFTTTITVSLYFALIISLPVILYELYGFILPALKPNERRATMPLLTAVPFLFATGVLFGYFVVLPAATRFLVNFNSGQFNVIVQASQYYSFAATILLAMGLVFQIPVLILGATRIGLVTPRQLRKNRRYAVLACAAVAAFLPGDAITLILETVPLYVLFEASILLATFVKPPGVVGQDAGSGQAQGAPNPAGTPAPTPEDPAQPTVQQIIDHVDRRLSD
jgi:sec-independent protein translocase protein TatC